MFSSTYDFLVFSRFSINLWKNIRFSRCFHFWVWTTSLRPLAPVTAWIYTLGLLYTIYSTNLKFSQISLFLSMHSSSNHFILKLPTLYIQHSKCSYFPSYGEIQNVKSNLPRSLKTDFIEQCQTFTQLHNKYVFQQSLKHKVCQTKS